MIPFATTWMDLETVIPSVVRYRKRNIILYHLLAESKKKKKKKWHVHTAVFKMDVQP